MVFAHEARRCVNNMDNRSRSPHSASDLPPVAHRSLLQTELLDRKNSVLVSYLKCAYFPFLHSGRLDCIPTVAPRLCDTTWRPRAWVPNRFPFGQDRRDRGFRRFRWIWKSKLINISKMWVAYDENCWTLVKSMLPCPLAISVLFLFWMVLLSNLDWWLHITAVFLL